MYCINDLTYIVLQQVALHLRAFQLFNREIIGYCTGSNKDAALVSLVFSTVQGDLRKFQCFYTYRGSEFKNEKMDNLWRPLKLVALSVKRHAPMTMQWLKPPKRS